MRSRGPGYDASSESSFRDGAKGRARNPCSPTLVVMDSGFAPSARPGLTTERIAMTGRLIGIGVGPGDPELVTLKALRALAEADVVAHFAKAGHESHARAIVAAHLAAGVTELPLLYPVTTEQPKTAACYRDAIRAFYDASAAAIAAHLDAGRTVAVIAEGDPLFYGSYMHLHVRLAQNYPTEIVAGV